LSTVFTFSASMFSIVKAHFNVHM